MSETHDCQGNEYDEFMARNFLSSYRDFILRYYGDRCPDYAVGCPCCKAWGRYDAEFAASSEGHEEWKEEKHDHDAAS